jgi:hypothetical protein
MGDVGHKIAPHSLDTPGFGDVIEDDGDVALAVELESTRPHRERLGIRPRAGQRRFGDRRKVEVGVDVDATRPGTGYELAYITYGNATIGNYTHRPRNRVGEDDMIVSVDDEHAGRQAGYEPPHKLRRQGHWRSVHRRFSLRNRFLTTGRSGSPGVPRPRNHS